MAKLNDDAPQKPERERRPIPPGLKPPIQLLPDGSMPHMDCDNSDPNELEEFLKFIRERRRHGATAGL